MKIQLKIHKILALIVLVFGCKSKTEQKNVVIDGQQIEITESEIELSNDYSLEDLTYEQIKKIQLDIVEAEIFAANYSNKKEGILESENLDLILKKWKSDQSSDKKSEEKVIEIIGSAFGQNIVENLDSEWQIITDEYGTDFTVIHKEYFVNGFPYSSVYKAITGEREKSLDGIELIIKSKIQEAMNDGGIDRRKK